MMAILKAIGAFICGFVKLVKNVVFITFIFVIAVFILTIFMPENVQKAFEIFKNLF